MTLNLRFGVYGWLLGCLTDCGLCELICFGVLTLLEFSVCLLYWFAYVMLICGVWVDLIDLGLKILCIMLMYFGFGLRLVGYEFVVGFD